MNIGTLKSSVQKLTSFPTAGGGLYNNRLYHNGHNVPLAFIASTTNAKIKGPVQVQSNINRYFSIQQL